MASKSTEGQVGDQAGSKQKVEKVVWTKQLIREFLENYLRNRYDNYDDMIEAVTPPGSKLSWKGVDKDIEIFQDLLVKRLKRGEDPTPLKIRHLKILGYDKEARYQAVVEQKDWSNLNKEYKYSTLRAALLRILGERKKAEEGKALTSGG